jgi:hypothetical protein
MQGILPIIKGRRSTWRPRAHGASGIYRQKLPLAARVGSPLVQCGLGNPFPPAKAA